MLERVFRPPVLQNEWKWVEKVPAGLRRLKIHKNLGYMGYFAEKGRSESNQIY